MDALIIIGQLSIGGTEKHLTNVLPSLRERGIDIGVYCLKSGGELTPVLERGGIEVISPKVYNRGLIGMLFCAIKLIGRFVQTSSANHSLFSPRSLLVRRPLSAALSSDDRANE